MERAAAAAGVARRVEVGVGGFAAALALARASDLVATVPERHTRGLRAGLRAFSLPFPVPPLTISLLWHPRLDADGPHRWLRGCVLAVCAAEEVSTRRGPSPSGPSAARR